MATLKQVVSDSESDKPADKKKSSVAKTPAKGSKGSKEPTEPMDVDDDEDDGKKDGPPASDDGSEDAPEYEIEAIIDAQRGAFPEGRTGYYVKWKGYDETENSWVDERDAENATDLIQAFWKKFKKDQQSGRKSTDAKPKRPGRKSLTNEVVREKPASPAKKRGRPKAKPDNDSSVQEVSDGEDAEEERAPKKPRKSNGATTTKKAAAAKRATKTPEARVDDEDEDDGPIGDMKKYMTVPTWEHLIKIVETVERGDGGQLWVYFTLKKGDERVRENSKLCAEKFPQKLIQFYESNLKWKTDDEAASES